MKSVLPIFVAMLVISQLPLVTSNILKGVRSVVHNSAPSVSLTKQAILSKSLDRELSNRADYSSIEKLNNEIEDLHNNIKTCFDTEFDHSPEEIMAFTDILTKCAGENYSIVIQTYSRILFQVKEITKERIKNSMREGFCDDILFMCIDFFKAIELFFDL